MRRALFVLVGTLVAGLVWAVPAAAATGPGPAPTVTRSPSARVAAPAPGRQLPARQTVRPSQPANTFKWIDYETNRCLDSNYNGDVYTLPCNGGAFQQWWIGASFELCDYQTGRCLQSLLGSTIHAYFPNYTSPAEMWYFSQAVNVPVWQVENQDTLRCLDSNYQGAVYGLFANGGSFQAWYPA
jgi:hypothetical protein